ncbi:ATP-binding cassette domain-containing protein, partial [Conexibacter stalactiti]
WRRGRHSARRQRRRGRRELSAMAPPVDPRLLRASRAARSQLAAATALAVAAAVLVVAQAVLLADVIASVFIDGAGLAAVRGELVALVATMAARALVAAGFELSGRRGAAHVMSELRERLAEHLLVRRPLRPAERTGELATTAVQGVDALEAYLAGYVPQLAMAATVPAAVLGWVVLNDWLAALLLALGVPLLVLFMILIGRSAEAVTTARFRALSLLGAHFLDVVRGLETLRAHNRDRAQEATIAAAGERYRVETMAALRVAFMSALVLELVAMIGTALVAATVGIQLVEGALTLHVGLAVLLLAPELYAPLREVGRQYHAGADGLAAAERIFAVLDEPVATPAPGAAAWPSPDAAATASADDAPVPDPRTQPLRFEDVSFAHPRRGGAAGAERGAADAERGAAGPERGAIDAERGPAGAERGAVDAERGAAVLAGLTLTLEPGKLTALVGVSGAGKSTVAALALRLLDPSAGRVTCGGVDLRRLEPEAWRGQVAWVPQRARIFAGTVADNVRLAVPDAPDRKVRAALAAAGAARFVAALPQGIETAIGDGGRPLSAGEAQRIALARAFLRDAPLLVLDEPTAHLDAETATAVDAAILRLARGRTTLLIAHRPALAARADRVIVLADGRVAGDDALALAAPALGAAALAALAPPAAAPPFRIEQRTSAARMGRQTSLPPGAEGARPASSVVRRVRGAAATPRRERRPRLADASYPCRPEAEGPCAAAADGCQHCPQWVEA